MVLFKKYVVLTFESVVACVASVSVGFGAKNNLRNERQIPFLGLSLLRNHTETLATQAKSADKILWCYHSNKTSSVVLLHGAIICFSVFPN